MNIPILAYRNARLHHYAIGSALAVMLLLASASPTFAETTSSVATGDYYMVENNPQRQSGTEQVMEADGFDANSKDRYALLQFDDATIPEGATLTDADVTIQVTDASGGANYEAYALLKDWEEDGTWKATGASAQWQIAGAKGAGDAGATVLSRLNPNTTGPYSFDIPNSAVDGWLNGTSPNGIIIRGPSVTNNLIFRSSEYATASGRPSLALSYSLPIVDTDKDGVPDSADNCANTPNADQVDLDNDGKGDACDEDIDGDGVLNADDADPRDPNVQQAGNYITPQDTINIAAKINAAPAGTTFLIKDGTYNISTEIKPRANITLKGIYSDGSRPQISANGQDYVIDSSNADNLTVEGLTLRDAVHADGTRPDCGRGLGSGGDNITLRDVRLTNNANAGIGGPGAGLLVEDSLIDHNGYDPYFKTQGQPVSAGGVKSTQGFTLRNTVVSDNGWVGVWKDVDTVTDPIILENVDIYDNLKTGVSYEITSTIGTPSRISGSTIQGNGYGDTFSREAEVLIASASDLVIENNTFGDTATNPGNVSPLAVMAYQDSRPPGVDEASIIIRNNVENGDSYSTSGPTLDLAIPAT
jgi:hypothetical protein